MSKFLDIDGLEYYTKTFVKPGLTEFVDTIADKNELDINNYTSITGSGFNFNLNSDGSIDISWNNVSTIPVMRIKGCRVGPKLNGLMLSGCPVGGGLSTYRLDVRIGDDAQGTEQVVAYDSGEGSNSFNLSTDTVTIGFRIASSSGSVTIYPMICTLDNWNISHSYVPYRNGLATKEEIRDCFQNA